MTSSISKQLIIAAVLLGAANPASADTPTLFFKSDPSHPEVFSLKPTCEASENGCYIFVNDEHGNEIVRISERTGKVTIAHPEHLDEAARIWWHTVEIMFGKVCYTKESPK